MVFCSDARGKLETGGAHAIEPFVAAASNNPAANDENHRVIMASLTWRGWRGREPAALLQKVLVRFGLGRQAAITPNRASLQHSHHRLKSRARL
jgi:hypothetical protein